MNRIKQARRDAKRLFRLCLVNGLLDEGQVRRVVQRVSEARNRNRLLVLSRFQRLVRLDCARHTATVESSTPLGPALQASIQGGLSRDYGPGLNTSFTESPTLIGGMRIKVSSDVYDGSVRRQAGRVGSELLTAGDMAEVHHAVSEREATVAIDELIGDSYV